MELKRRDFLGSAALGIGSMALGSATISARETGSGSDLLAPVQLTKEVKCSKLGLGTGMRGSYRLSDMVRAGWPKSIELIQYAYDLGFRLFDCADMYGTHHVIAEALKGKPRDSYTLVTKVWVLPGGLPEKERLTPEELLPRFMRELRTDYIDIVQIHCMSKPDWPSQFESVMESLERLKKKGTIRAHGISSHSNAATEAAAKTDWCDVIHVRINSEGMNMDGPRDDSAKRVEDGLRTTKLAHEAGKGIIAMKVLGEGKMAGDAAMRKKSTEFVYGLDCVNVLIAAFDEKEHVLEFYKNAVEAAGRS